MEKRNLSQQTAQRLYNMIVVEKQLTAGEKLPNEVELAQQLSVSRATLREAIHALGGGWVGDEALAIAVFCVLRHPDNMADCLSAAATHDGDSDSTGAIAGNILGAWLGAEAIPTDWLDVLEMRDVIDDMAVRLCEAANE